MQIPKLLFSRSLLCGAIVVVAISPPATSAQTLSIPSHQTAGPSHTVVLKNGNVLSGTVVNNGKSWQISTQGVTLQVPDSNVNFVARSLTDAYEKQHSLLFRPTAGQHLQLAEWCMRQELLPQAARELAAARSLDPDHPRLALVERRLAVLSASSSTAHEPRKTTDGLRPGNQQDSSDEAMVAAAQSLVDTLPDGALEQFNRRVQPVLVNNCTAAGCHGEQGPTDFQLSRALLYDEANRATTLRNLAATFAQIDREKPHRSPLLTIPLRSHGGRNEPVFPAHRRQLHDQLKDWVFLVTGEKQASPKRPPIVSNATALPYPLASPVQRGTVRSGRAKNRRSPNVQYGARFHYPPPSADLPTPGTDGR